MRAEIRPININSERNPLDTIMYFLPILSQFLKSNYVIKLKKSSSSKPADIYVKLASVVVLDLYPH